MLAPARCLRLFGHPVVLRFPSIAPGRLALNDFIVAFQGSQPCGFSIEVGYPKPRNFHPTNIRARGDADAATPTRKERSACFGPGFGLYGHVRILRTAARCGIDGYDSSFD